MHALGPGNEKGKQEEEVLFSREQSHLPARVEEILQDQHDCFVLDQVLSFF